MTEANRILLGVNIDHVATLRQARGTRYPDPVKAALDAEEAGAACGDEEERKDQQHVMQHCLGRLSRTTRRTPTAGLIT